MPDAPPSLPATAAAPGPVALQPAIRLPLLGQNDGSISWPVVEFTPAGDRMVVVDFYSRFWSVSNLRWHAPDLAILCMMLAFGWVVHRAWKNRSSRLHAGMVGRWLCRRCGYDLTPPGTDPAVRTAPCGLQAVCPECATPTSTRPPRQSRSRARRMIGPIVAFLIICGGAAAVLNQTLEPVPPAPAWANPWEAWPSPLLSGFLAHALFIPRLQRCENAAHPDAHRLTLYELPTAREIARIDGLVGGYADYRFTPDGTWCIAGASTWDEPPRISAVDLRSSPPRAYSWPVPRSGRCWVVPLLQNPHEVLIAELARADGQPWGPGALPPERPTPNVVIRGWSLDAETGKRSLLFEVPVTLDAPALLGSLSLSLWQAEPTGDSPAWTAVLQTLGARNRFAPKSTFRIFWITPREVRSIDTVHPGKCSMNPWPERDGVSLPLFIQTNAGARSTATLDTRTGAITPGPPEYIWKSPDGLLTSAQGPTGLPGFAGPDGAMVACTYLDKACIQTRPDEQGRWAWVNWQGSPPPPWLVNIAGQRFRNTEFIAVWDLEPIKQSIRSGHPPAAPPPAPAPNPIAPDPAASPSP